MFTAIALRTGWPVYRLACLSERKPGPGRHLMKNSQRLSEPWKNGRLANRHNQRARSQLTKPGEGRTLDGAPFPGETPQTGRFTSLNTLQNKKVAGRRAHRMFADVEAAAQTIAADLGFKPGCDTSPMAAFDLCQMNGGNLLAGNYPWINGGLYFPCLDYIVIDDNLPAPAKATVTIHELVHRLLYGQAYEPLNDVRFSDYDRREFGELVCRAVERRYVEAGGFPLRKSASLTARFAYQEAQN